VTAPDPTASHRAWTWLGAMSADGRAVVDTRGLVTADLAGDGWSLDWWVGADDRWHLPQDEPSVRQQLIGETPVVETAMRIPGGDAVHRAYVAHGSVDRLVVEVENRSAVPFALALAVRPANPRGPAPIMSIELDGTDLRVDGRIALQLSKPPARAASRVGADGDVVDLVVGGEAPTELAPVRSADGTASAALIFPLPHTAVLRVALPLGTHDGTGSGTEIESGPGVVAALPSAERVAKGWEAQVRRGLRVVLPSEALSAAVEANRSFLLVAHAGDHLTGRPGPDELVTTLRALDEWGFHDEVAEVLAASEHEPASGAVLVALAAHWRLTHDRELVDALSAALAGGVSRLARTGRLGRLGRDRPAIGDRWRVPGLQAAAELLAATGQTRAAEAVRRQAAVVAARVGAIPVDGPPDGWSSPRMVAERARDEVASGGGVTDDMSWLLSVAGPRRTWPERVRDHEVAGDGHDLAAGAAFLGLVRSMLVRETTDPDPTLALCSVWPVDWLGQGIEVHDAPTDHGRLSFAVRWHGERPALLWDLERHDTSDVPVRLVVPGLDTTWASRDPRGEALLARPPEPAGGAGPEEGASFS
jgi:hypothetical protein